VAEAGEQKATEAGQAVAIARRLGIGRTSVCGPVTAKPRVLATLATNPDSASGMHATSPES